MKCLEATPEGTPETWGACGTKGCTECLPLFDAQNAPIQTIDDWGQ